jgi:hypothetical protein
MPIGGNASDISTSIDAVLGIVELLSEDGMLDAAGCDSLIALATHVEAVAGLRPGIVMLSR